MHLIFCGSVLNDSEVVPLSAFDLLRDPEHDPENRIYNMDAHLRSEVCGSGDLQIFRPRICAYIYPIEVDENVEEVDDDAASCRMISPCLKFTYNYHLYCRE